MPGPRSRPSIPQLDADQERATRLDAARQTYQWTESIPTVPGLPANADVPEAEKPPLGWLIATTLISARIDANSMVLKREPTPEPANSGIVGLFKSIASSVLGHLRDDVESVEEAAKRWVARVEEIVGTVQKVESREEEEQHVEKLREHLSALFEVATTAPEEAQLPKTLANYDSQYQEVPLPPIQRDFQTNAAFARQRVTGPNPMVIRRIDALPENFPVTDAQFRSVMGEADSLAVAGSEGRLFLCDYSELNALKPFEGGGRYYAVPLALFAVPADGESIVPVAIQCGQDPKEHGVIVAGGTADEPDYNWMMARQAVQVADAIHHELFAHLARTHLVLEAFVVATHRQLSDNHPVNVLLMPHLQGTISINYAAATKMIADGGPIAAIIGSTIKSAQLAAVADRLAMDFDASMLRNDLESRGVQEGSRLVDYPYRDDALLIWDAIAGWVREYLGLYYASDEDVSGDTELQAWYGSLVGPGRIGGMAPVGSVDRLGEVLTMAIFTASAQHAAVNFPQASIWDYVPNMTGALWAPAPTEAKPATRQDWLDMLPPLDVSHKQINMLELLGSAYYNLLGDYRTHHFPYRQWFEDPRVEAPLEGFRAALKAAEKVITARNEHRAVPYEFLLPSLIPASINI